MRTISDEDFQILMDESLNCVICNKSLNGEGDIVTLIEKGCDGIKRASLKRADNITTVPAQQVHQNSRQEYCCPALIELKKLFQKKQLLVAITP